MSEFENVNQYKQFVQKKTNEIFNNREKFLKEKFFLCFQNKLKNLNIILESIYHKETIFFIILS